MTRVLFFEVDSVFGGIESFLLNMVRNVDLKNGEFKFDFVTSANNPAASEDFKKAGVHIINVGNKKNIVHYYRNLNTIFAKGNYNIVHIQKNSLSNPLPLILAKKHHVPFILHAQNSAPSISNAIIRNIHIINRWLYANKASTRLACGETAAKWMFNTLEGVRIVKNGINPEEFKLNEEVRHQVRKEHNISNDDLVICNVGRFTDQKNHKFIIQVFYEIYKKSQSSKLFLVGDGTNMTNIKELVRNLKIERNVVFFGSLERDQESKVLMSADVFLMPSIYEGVSIASVEAQMAGLQLIMSDTVDKDTNITGDVIFLSLDKHPREWAEIIIKQASTNRFKYDYKSIVNRIRKAGYDMKYTSENLLKLYAAKGNKEC